MASDTEIDSEGHLELKGDPEAWIKNNPASRLILARSLKLNLYGVEEIGGSIGQLTQLTCLDFSACESLKCVPNTITRLHNLERLEFHQCFCLEELPPNIGQLVSLTHLHLFDCYDIKSLPNSIANLSNLTSLSLSFCNSLVQLPANIGLLVSLTHLKLWVCNNINFLPASIVNLSKLTSLSIQFCDFLAELPSNLGLLKSLTNFELSDCHSIKSLPDSMKNLCNLETLLLDDCNFLTQLPVNLNVLHLKLIGCCFHSLPKFIIKLKYLDITVCNCSHQSFLNMSYSVSLQHLAISKCIRHRISVIKLPASLDQMANLQALSLHHDMKFVELPPNLNKLAHLSLIDIHKSGIKCLPWSITKLRKLRHLMLSDDFRLQTLPYELNNSVLISVKHKRVRKSWEELKEEMKLSSVPIVGAEIPNDAAENPFITSPPGYLRLERDLPQCIINNTNLFMLVRFLDLENVNKLIYSITAFSELTHLYITNAINLPDNYFVTLVRLRHLYLEFDLFDVHKSVFQNLSKLSNLETLHLKTPCNEVPPNVNLPVSLIHLSLSYCNMRPLYDSLAMLSNLKTLDLYSCDCRESLPQNLCLDKLKLNGCFIESLPIGLHHLEILLFDEGLELRCFFEKCWNQLIDLKTLSITSFDMEILPEEIARLRNLQILLLKDCVRLKKLPSNIHELDNLQTLDISITRIKSLPPSFVKPPNLHHLILPKCFNLDSLSRNLKQVSIIDDTEETYYKCMDYDASLYQTSTTVDESEETEQGLVTRENCNEGNDNLPITNEIVPAEQTPVDPLNGINMICLELNTSEQDGISQINKGYISPKEMPDNINVMNTRLKYQCSMQSPPRGLMKAEHLKISLCTCSKELLANLKESMNLRHLAIKDCSQHHVKKFPTNFGELANLKTFSIRCIHIESLPSFAGLSSLLKLYIGGVSTLAPRLEKLPADLDKLDRLLAVDIHDTKIKCLPWSIKKLQKLRFLFLPLDFRLETLPCQLIEPVIITVDCMHIRKTWKELKTEMGLLSFRGVGVDEAQNFSTISSSGYLQLKEDPGLWIMKNYNLCGLVRSLELELSVNMLKIGDSIGELPKLIYLYISGNINLDLKCLSGISKTLRHLSLQHCNTESISDSLRKLSNLESICLDLGDTNLPDNLDLLVNLKRLSLCHGSKHSNIDSMAKLSNIKVLDLFQCDFKSLPENLNLAELKLSGSSIRSLPTSLYRLEILHDKGTCKRTECDATLSNLKLLVNMEKLSVTCYSMELLPSIERLQNLHELQLKDCSSLEALPNYLGKLVKLCTLDISGTRIKSLPDSITKLYNLEHLILPKCFQQDCSLMYPNKGLINVTIDDIVELYFNDMSYDADDRETSMETSDEGNGIELDSIEGHNEAISKEFEEGKINAQSSPRRLHVTPLTGDFCSNRRENSNPEGQSIPAIRNDSTIMETEQGNCDHGQNQTLQNDMKGKKRKEISLETLQSFWSKKMTLEEAAEESRVSRSTMKRRLKDLKQVWPSSRKGKQHLDAKKRKHNNKALIGSDCSQQNLVNPGNLAADLEIVGKCTTGADQLTLPNQVSSTSNAIRENLMETQGDMDSHRHAEEHLDGANERTVSNTLQQNENSSKFIVKATYKGDTIKFKFSLSCSIDQLKEEVANQLELEANTFKIRYEDEDKDWILMNNISNLEDALKNSKSNNSSAVRLSIDPKT